MDQSHILSMQYEEVYNLSEPAAALNSQKNPAETVNYGYNQGQSVHISQYFLSKPTWTPMFQSSPSPLLKMETLLLPTYLWPAKYHYQDKVSSSDASLASPDLNLIPWEREFITLPLDQTKQLKILVSLATNTKPSIVRPIASELAIIKSVIILRMSSPGLGQPIWAYVVFRN